MAPADVDSSALPGPSATMPNGSPGSFGESGTRSHDESLSFEEFAGWAGGSQLVDEMLSHLHVFDRTPWHEQRSAKDRGLTRLGGPVTKPTPAVAKLAEAERATAAQAAVAGPSYDAS